MRELYLHIGLPKTGTSYIQRMLGQNAEGLLAAGIGVGPYIDPANGDSRRMRLAINELGLVPVMERLAASPGETLVVSSEHLSPAMLDRRVAEAVRNAARRHFIPKIVIFLRRQDYLKESLFSQEVKNWYAGDIQGETTFDYDLDRRVADLEAVFGHENVKVRLYRDGTADSILASFLDALGADVPLRASARSAGRTCRCTVARCCSSPVSPRPEPTVQDLSLFMTRVVMKTGSIADDGIRFLMSPRERHALVARHLEGNRALVARHGIPDAGSFIELPDPDAAWRPPAPISRAEFLAVSAEALETCFAFRNRRGLGLAGRLARLLPQMAHRLFSRRHPGPPRSRRRSSCCRSRIWTRCLPRIPSPPLPERSVERAGRALYEGGNRTGWSVGSR